MNDEVQRLFHAVVDLPKDQRERVLSGESIDREVRAEVESLLSFDSTGLHNITGCIAATAGRVVGSFESHDLPTCGPYRLVRLLAKGGMGAVYLGERTDGEIKQNVAIKLLNAEEQRPGWHERFLR